MKKKLLFMVMIITIVGILLSSCRGSEKSDKIVVGATTYKMSEFMVLMKEGIDAEIRDQNAELVWLSAEFDSNKQIEQVENLIAQKVDVIILIACDSDALVPAIAMCRDANIPLVAANVQLYANEEYYYVGPNDIQAGELEAQYLVDVMGDTGNIVILQCVLGTSFEAERSQGNYSVLSKYPNIRVLAADAADGERHKAIGLMENWMTAFGKIDGVIAQNDDMALGAIQALHAAGYTNVPVVGIDAIKDALLSIKNGEMTMTVYQDGIKEGRDSVALALNLVRGIEPAKKMNLIEMTVVDKSNVDEILAVAFGQ